MTSYQRLDAESLLARVAERVPEALRGNVVVVGSIATAWAYRDIAGEATVATKDIDLLLRPAIDAVSAAETLASQLLEQDWEPVFPNDRQPGNPEIPDNELPALRLRPPGEAEGWFVELLGDPQPDQTERRAWRRFETAIGHFGLPCFRFMPVAVHGAEPTGFGIRTARPAQMALAHLLEHAAPDTTPISGLPGNPPRFTKDVGRAIALWWLANKQSQGADAAWLAQWRGTPAALLRQATENPARTPLRALDSLAPYLRDAHTMALSGVLAPYGTSFEAWQRAHASLANLIEQR